MEFLKLIRPTFALTCAFLIVPLSASAAQIKKDSKVAEHAPVAQEAAVPQPHALTLKPEPAQSSWIKVCGQEEAMNKEVCFTTREYVTPEQDQPIMTVALYDVKGMPEKVLRLRLPLSLRLQPGVRINMDKGQSIEGKYAMCLPNGCYVEIPIKEEFITALKKGKTLRIRAQNQIGEEIIFEAPSEGFESAYDGKALDSKELAEQQKKLQEALLQRSEAMRKKFEAESKSLEKDMTP
jgi:invasion protein IalB